MRYAIIGLVLVAMVATMGCRTFIIDEGSVIVQTSVRVGMRWGLQELGTTQDQALRYRLYVQESKQMLVGGQLPGTVLDDLAAFLNEKLDHDILRSVIQHGVEIVKERVTFPQDGPISEEVKTWIYSILDGAIAGIDDYVGGLNNPELRRWSVPENYRQSRGPGVINFR